MKRSKPGVMNGLSWMAYGVLSVCMVAIAAVAVTVGQDKETQLEAPSRVGSGMGGGGMEGPVMMGGGMGGGVPETPEQMERRLQLQQERKVVLEQLRRNLYRTLNPNAFSRGGRGRVKYAYAVNLHSDEQSLENLVRFQVTRIEHAKKAKPQLVGTGVMVLSSQETYVETPSKSGLQILRPLNREHLVAMKNFGESHGKSTASYSSRK